MGVLLHGYCIVPATGETTMTVRKFIVHADAIKNSYYTESLCCDVYNYVATYFVHRSPQAANLKIRVSE